MQHMIPLHQEIRPLPAAELDWVATLIRATKRESAQRVDVAFLADVAHDFPVLFREDYQQRFPGL